jgi:NAD(P)-dependent dehydrogenase (short-subunit alcohol dehydrogenase family)
MTPLLDRVALVTGSSKGIGKGIALALAAQGCDLIINYNSDKAGGEAVADEVRALGRKAVAVKASTAVPADVEALFAAADAAFPRLDILVNNAAVQTWKSLLDLTLEEWDRVHHTNLRGSFHCTQLAARRMLKSGGSIVNIGSGCNRIAFPMLVDYTASKGGLEMLTKVSAVELGRHQIRVNCVAPGSIEVERTKQEAGDYAGTWAPLTPLGRIGLPEDVARAVCFFASDESRFVTGQTLFVDGGLFSKPHWPYELP